MVAGSCKLESVIMDHKVSGAVFLVHTRPRSTRQRALYSKGVKFQGRSTPMALWSQKIRKSDRLPEVSRLFSAGQSVNLWDHCRSIRANIIFRANII